MLFHKQSTENIQSCVLYELSLSAVSDMYHQSWKYESTLTLSVVIILLSTIMDRSPWESNAIFSFFFWVPSLNSASFLKLIFLAVLPPPYTKLKFRKNSGYMCPTLFVGWGEGLDLCELEMPRNAKVSQDFCPWL